MTRPPPLDIVDDQPSFTCMDCGCAVYQFPVVPPPDPPRCLTCQWIANVPDAVDRGRVRRWLQDLEASHDQSPD